MNGTLLPLAENKHHWQSRERMRLKDQIPSQSLGVVTISPEPSKHSIV